MKFIVCSFLFIIVKGIIGIKYFLDEIYCLFLFGFDSEKWETKCLMLCISIMRLFVYKCFYVAYKFKISRPKYFFEIFFKL